MSIYTGAHTHIYICLDSEDDNVNKPKNALETVSKLAFISLLIRTFPDGQIEGGRVGGVGEGIRMRQNYDGTAKTYFDFL